MSGGLEPLSIDAHVPAPLRLRDALWVFTSPGKVFARAEDTGAYGWALLVLLVSVLLMGYAQVQTGLIDQDVARNTEKQLEQLEREQLHLLDRVEFAERVDGIQKHAEFMRMISRLGVIVAAPIYFLASFLLISSVLYAAVALTGVKPEYHTLMSICVYSGFIELAAYGLQLGMMLTFKTTQVTTSLGVLATPGKPSFLYAIDPFRIWFWVLVGAGLIVTHQLGRKMAIFCCTLMCLAATGVRAAAAMQG